MLTDQERITSHFNATAKCRWRTTATPKLKYEPGCSYIECQHTDCKCRMNDGDGGPLTEFLAKWTARHA